MPSACWSTATAWPKRSVTDTVPTWYPTSGTGVMVTVVPSLAAVGFTVTVPFSVSPMVIL